MNIKLKWIIYFLRFSLALGFLSAVADRFGFWPQEISAWGNWSSFVEYTGVLNPWAPIGVVPFVAILATVLEILLGILLLVGYKLKWVAQASGILLLLFALAMIITSGIKAPLDYSVLTAAAAAFALAYIVDTSIKPF